MQQAPQSTSLVVMLKLFLSSDHITAATGKTLAITISKNGGAFGNPNAGATNATEVSNGWYKVTLDTTDTNTLGDLVVRGTAASCDDSERVYTVVKATNGGLTALPDAAAGANTGLPVVGTQVPNATAGAAGGVLIAGSNAATTFNGTAASGATPATAGLTIVGGAASTTGGGTSAPAISLTGGAGAASTNGAASGLTSTGGGTTTVSGGSGFTLTGTGNLHGMFCTGSGSASCTE